MGLPAEEINRRITAVTERFGIKHLLNRSIFHLSGGQKQRVIIGSALMCGGLLSHLHFQYANDLHTLVSTDEATGTETLPTHAGTPPCALMREPPRTAAPSSEPCITCSK